MDIELTRDERKLLENRIISAGIEALWENLYAAVQRVVTAHNDLHRDEAKVALNDHDTAIRVSYSYRALDAFAVIESATLKFALDRTGRKLKVTGNPGKVREMQNIGQFEIVCTDLASKTIEFANKKASGSSMTALQLAEWAVTERFFDKKAKF